MNGRLYVAAIQTDDPHKWHPRAFNPRTLHRLVRKKQSELPENRIVAQHAHCALDYSCPTASNLFFGRWEMAIAVSPGCNARCIGCISKQEEEDLISPQDRLTFIPTVGEILRSGNTSPRTSRRCNCKFWARVRRRAAIAVAAH